MLSNEDLARSFMWNSYTYNVNISTYNSMLVFCIFCLTCNVSFTGTILIYIYGNTEVQFGSIMIKIKCEHMRKILKMGRLI